MTIRLIYTAGAYTADHSYLVQRNIDKARLYAQEIALLGAMPVCPQMMSAHFDGIGSYDWWCQSTMAVMRRCDAVCMLPQWESSKGATAEHEEALRLEIPVFYHLSELKRWLINDN